MLHEGINTMSLKWVIGFCLLCVAVPALAGFAAPATSATPMASTNAAQSIAEPAAVVRFYYAAINAGKLRCAYGAWANKGDASGQTFAEFADGYAHTQRVDVQTSEPGRVDAAAGSRYVTIPVTLKAVQNDGSIQRFSGHYVLRRAVVPGATREQRQWRLYTAEIKRATALSSE